MHPSLLGPVRFGLALFAMIAAAMPSRAAVQLPRVLGSRMVLQQGVAVPVWGTADAGERVTVTFRDQSKAATADATGKWLVRLDPLRPGKPAVLTVSGTNTLVLEDVLVGEVWVGSGQSNLDSDVTDYTAFDDPLKKAAEAEQPQVRLYRSDAGDGWQAVTPKALRRYSAQLFYFGVKLQQELGVPVGVMEGAVRGSSAYHWLTEGMVQASPGMQAVIAELEAKTPYAVRKQRYEEQLAEWEKARAALPAGQAGPKKPAEPLPAGRPTGEFGDFYEKHIRPMQPYSIRGILWDQGEGGTGIAGVKQDALMPALVAGWRKDWGQGDFPFVYQQKPSGGGPALDPANPVTRGADVFATLPKEAAQAPGHGNRRGEYFYFSTVPNAYMVFTSDLMPGVHPQNKSGYATRAAMVATGAVYQRPVVYQGPVFDSADIRGAEMRIKFKNTGGGLTCPAGQPLQGFSIAGKDRKFHWAKAVIDGDSVIVSSPEVPEPVAARYAWTTTYTAEIPWANLFNAEGLPALSFRTDPSM